MVLLSSTPSSVVVKDPPIDTTNGAGSSGPRQTLSRISPGEGRGPRDHHLSKQEPADARRQLEVEMVLVRRVVVGRENTVEDAGVCGRADDGEELLAFRGTRFECANRRTEPALEMVEHDQLFTALLF